MMIHAYNELYLSDAKKNLADMLDYAVNDCRIEGDWFISLFIHSGFARHYGNGNPAVIAGMSGVELTRAVLTHSYKTIQLPAPSFHLDRSPEYWAGWAAAEYQWYSCKSFRDIFRQVPLSEMISMYPVFHEMDITQFIDEMDERCKVTPPVTKLKEIRISRGMSQVELAESSKVKLRSIQMYEQRANDINRAQARTLYYLARVLCCDIEDLLENA